MAKTAQIDLKLFMLISKPSRASNYFTDAVASSASSGDVHLARGHPRREPVDVLRDLNVLLNYAGELFGLSPFHYTPRTCDCLIDCGWLFAALRNVENSMVSEALRAVLTVYRQSGSQPTSDVVAFDLPYAARVLFSAGFGIVMIVCLRLCVLLLGSTAGSTLCGRRWRARDIVRDCERFEVLDHISWTAWSLRKAHLCGEQNYAAS